MLIALFKKGFCIFFDSVVYCVLACAAVAVEVFGRCHRYPRKQPVRPVVISLQGSIDLHQELSLKTEAIHVYQIDILPAGEDAQAIAVIIE